MSKKDFNKGIVAGAKPFEEKFELQNQAIERVGENLNNRFDELDMINDALINDLTSIEKRRLYDLNTVVDIAELDNTEKEFLIALIYTVSNKSDNITELQKSFLRSVKNYLDIKSAQVEVDLSLIENIENINSQKAILQTIMEFLFLNNGNHTYIEDYKDLLSYFSVNRRGIEEIQNKIDVIYKATGLEGIAENYGYIAEKDLEVAKINGFDGEITELEIKKILSIERGDTKIIKNSIVHIDTFITCEGTLIFENCTLSYNLPNCTNKIVLKEGANLEILNSKVICKKIDEDAFIKGEGSNKVVFKSCEFHECSYFIKLDNGDNTELVIDNCNIINPGSHFFEANVKKGMMINCSIKNYINTDDGFYNNIIFNSSTHSDEEFIIKECIVYGDELQVDREDENLFGNMFSRSKTIFNIDNGIFENCSFLNVNDCIRYCKEIKQCEFIKCNNVIDIGSIFDENCKITNCIFKECQNVIKAQSTCISNCQFEKCIGNIMDNHENVTVEFCEFYNVRNRREEGVLKESSIKFIGGRYSEDSTLRNCIFDGVDLKQMFLISGDVYDKASEPVVYIEDSVFKNCKTERESGKLISEYAYYLGLFNRKVDVKSVSIRNCIGLDNINKEDSYNNNVVIKSETDKGIKIGATAIV